MRISVIAAVLMTLIPTGAFAESWQDWVEQNPAYPIQSPPAPATNPVQVPALPSAATPPATPSVTNRYPDIYVQAFMDGCAQDPAYINACTCVIEQIQATYSLEEVTALIEYNQQQQKLPPELLEITASCVSAVP
jgi:hypothetical protein